MRTVLKIKLCQLCVLMMSFITLVIVIGDTNSCFRAQHSPRPLPVWDACFDMLCSKSTVGHGCIQSWRGVAKHSRVARRSVPRKRASKRAFPKLEAHHLPKRAQQVRCVPAYEWGSTIEQY
jgi:hypothetical protein